VHDIRVNGEEIMLSTSTAIPVHRFSTADCAPRERVPAWRELYGRTIARLEFEPLAGGELMAEAELRNLPGLGLVSMKSTELRFDKPRSLINNDDVVFMIVETGRWRGAQLGREADLEAGDAVLCTNGEVANGYALGHRTMLRVPTAAIGRTFRDMSDRLSRRIPRDTPALGMLRRYLRITRDTESFAQPELQRAAVTHVHDLLAVTIGATRDATRVAEVRGMRAARLQAIKEDIAGNLEHGDLSVNAVAARHRVTPRYVQKLFEHEGTTFSDHVLGQRLAHAHRLLSDPRRAADRIACVAFAAGFGDVSYFYRAFRRQYGVRPSDVRAESGARR
jgi:AraC-like DNA-binding protein